MSVARSSTAALAAVLLLGLGAGLLVGRTASSAIGNKFRNAVVRERDRQRLESESQADGGAISESKSAAQHSTKADSPQDSHPSDTDVSPASPATQSWVKDLFGVAETWADRTGYSNGRAESFHTVLGDVYWTDAQASTLEIKERFQVVREQMVSRVGAKKVINSVPWSDTAFQVWGFGTSYVPTQFRVGRDFWPLADPASSLAWHANDAERVQVDAVQRELLIRTMANAARKIKETEHAIVHRALKIISSGRSSQIDCVFHVDAQGMHIAELGAHQALSDAIEKWRSVPSAYDSLARELLR